MVKTEFSIKDLENLSNVKAHTIRIWEKRYNLLKPDRTETNIRRYDLEDLKKLLNIAYLYRSGYKISTLAQMDYALIQDIIRENCDNLTSNYAIEVFKSIMLEFDGERFDITLENLLLKKTFRETFTEVFVPLLIETGILWHTGTIDPSHEHFISEKIKHAIIIQSKTKKVMKSEKQKPVFALFLPSGEIHEIGLLYANYELLQQGFQTIYLGPNIPLESVKHILDQKPQTQFLTYFTVRPEMENIESYIHDFWQTVCPSLNCKLWVLGSRIETMEKNTDRVRFFSDIHSFITALEQY